MKLANEIQNKGIGYWDFKNVKSSGIHKICSYPATMVPSMQNELIRLIKQESPEIKNILDPFHGSGVTLVEGAKNELLPIGIDINPMASLITKVKLQGIDKKEIKRSNDRVLSRLVCDNTNYEIHTFPNIEKWYRSDIIDTFSKIRSAIKCESTLHIRQYYWVCLIDLLKKYSNTRSSTFKLHIKKMEDIDSMTNFIIEEFAMKIIENIDYLPDYAGECTCLMCGKSEDLLKELESNSVDLICTSPPYGDNATTVTYGQYSILPLFWIDRKDLDIFDDILISTFSGIDANSLGGSRKYSENKAEFRSMVLETYLSGIAVTKRKKVLHFIQDYLCVMEQLSRVLKHRGYIVLTLGNRRVDNKVVPLVEVTQEFFESKGFTLETSISRNIPSKRMPKRVSKVGENSVESMNQEYVLILRKSE